MDNGKFDGYAWVNSMYLVARRNRDRVSKFLTRLASRLLISIESNADISINFFYSDLITLCFLLFFTILSIVCDSMASASICRISFV